MNKPLKPWSKGPYELIVHANGHADAGEDLDRRIALIGYDNAVEICIDVFVNLNPRLRGNYQITNEDKPKILRSFHSKIDFLARLLEERNISLEVTVEELLWYHGLRNELYHSGNGMVPELYVIEGAKKGAINVFEFLFEEECFSKEYLRETNELTRYSSYSKDPRMMFLSELSNLEKFLRQKVECHIEEEKLNKMTLGKLWSMVVHEMQLPETTINQFKDVIMLRNKMVHSYESPISDEEIYNSIQIINKIIDICN